MSASVLPLWCVLKYFISVCEWLIQFLSHLISFDSKNSHEFTFEIHMKLSFTITPLFYIIHKMINELWMKVNWSFTSELWTTVDFSQRLSTRRIHIIQRQTLSIKQHDYSSNIEMFAIGKPQTILLNHSNQSVLL